MVMAAKHSHCSRGGKKSFLGLTLWKAIIYFSLCNRSDLLLLNITCRLTSRAAVSWNLKYHLLISHSSTLAIVSHGLCSTSICFNTWVTRWMNMGLPTIVMSTCHLISLHCYTIVASVVKEWRGDRGVCQRQIVQSAQHSKLNLYKWPAVKATFTPLIWLRRYFLFFYETVWILVSYLF